MDASPIESVRHRHHLQRLESPSKGFSGAWHALGLFNFYSAFKFLVDNPNVFTNSFGWHLQFLTIVGLCISALSFLFAFLADMTMSPTLFTVKNYLSLLATPIEILISILYWGLRAVRSKLALSILWLLFSHVQIDPKLVMSPDLPVLPFLPDARFHLFPPIFLTVDALLLSPPWPAGDMHPRASTITLVVTSVFALEYFFWLELCYHKNGFYPYPILEMLSGVQRTALFVLSAALAWGVGVCLRMAYALLNGAEAGGEAGKEDVKKNI
ncbi:hypothetical protein M011DRAFT_197461 [Sporormia fimetaria CBS 119925]|uniref:Integral membrane protein n=1 Tax=Sporormia fimetaria CBS 119925 TaxID=1340428 RepID=A0A6A6V2N0_9PLEO|nr:hypothetical protein M011DRAFT_197461 [Sporormia fimetaria CBS 119925]